MNRSTNFFIGLAAALVTFGTLTLAFGPRHTHWQGHHRYSYNKHDGHHHYWGPCRDNDHENQNDPTGPHNGL